MSAAARGKLPSAAVLRRLLDYDPATGVLTWRARGTDLFNETEGRSADHACALWNSRYAGTEAFTAADGSGYRSGCILHAHCKAHRAIWAIVTGDWPVDQVDHINGVRTDNRWVNLRAADNQANSRNRKLQSNNKSGRVGVSWDRRDGSWRAYISLDRRVHLGCFDTFEAAVAARTDAEAKFGYHPNHGRS